MNEKRATENGKGNCFSSAVDTLILLSNNGQDKSCKLVHGLVTSSSGDTAGLVHSHAWVERFNEVVFDFSNGNEVIMPIKDYYALGKITKIKKYNPSEAFKLLVDTGHYGPWDKMFDNYC